MLKSGKFEKFNRDWESDETHLAELGREADALPHIDVDPRAKILASYIIRANAIAARYYEISERYRTSLDEDAAAVAERRKHAQERFNRGTSG